MKAYRSTSDPNIVPLTHAALSVRNATTTPENKRLSALTDDNHDSKRDSQVSTTSTNASAKGRRRKTHIGPWLLGSDIGKGGCGKVRKVKHSLTGQVAAAKIISKKIAETARAESLLNLVEAQKVGNGVLGLPNSRVMPFGVEREVVIMKLLEHPNIVKLYDVWENRNELYLVMEHVDGGELFEYVGKVGCLREDETVWVFRQVVAALLHCHRLGIHHRDLKPENILLDSSDHPQVKLIDFGMAALQPVGQNLTTPCGSIHYAAPEVFERNYDGSKVDVWSLGVILYVMLTGNTPFAYDVNTMKNDTERWYRLIKAGKFEIPNHVSPQAADLIRKMLVPDPRRRILLEECWTHPLVRTYNRIWSNEPRENELDYWIGPRPVIENWTLDRESDIEREILINLRCLWHSVDEVDIVQKLLNKEPNQEKYFYSALQKHRDEQLENYVGSVDAMGYSSSDYHHVKAPQPEELPPVPASAYLRTKSQFSIMDDREVKDVKQSRTSLKGTASVSSYDPYRSSRSRLVQDHARDSPRDRSHSRHKRAKLGQSTTSRPGTATSRISMLKAEARHGSRSSSRTSLRVPSSSPLMPTGRRSRSMSRASVASSYFASSPPGDVVRPASRSKRSVQFGGHTRHSSITTSYKTLPNLREDSTPPQTPIHQKPSLDSRLLAHKLNSSPATMTGDLVRSKKESTTAGPSAIRSRKPRTQSQVLDNEARKISTELEKYCEEVFYRSSGSSSQPIETARVYRTPPASIFQHQSILSQNIEDRALMLDGAGASETPNTYIAKELAETRKRLAARYASDEFAKSPVYQEVLAHLDSLLSGNGKNSSAGSTELPRAGDHVHALPMISEETKSSDSPFRLDNDILSQPKDRKMAITQPVIFPQPSIRMVNHSSPSKPAPLVIRKSSGGTTGSVSTSDTSSRRGQRHHAGQSTMQQDDKRSQTAPSSPLTLISEGSYRDDVKVGDAKPSRMRGWFGRKRLASGESEPKSPTSPRGMRFADLDDRMKPDSRAINQPATSSLAMTKVDNKSGFFAFLRKKRTASANARLAMGRSDDENDTEDSFPTISVNSNQRRLQPSDVQKQMEARDLGVQQNWLARFFNIKPASKIICFQRGRGVARQELFRLLRSWRMYGMKDILLDRNRNLIWGGLATPNCESLLSSTAMSAILNQLN